jgi:hypothetical protein
VEEMREKTIKNKLNEYHIFKKGNYCFLLVLKSNQLFEISESVYSQLNSGLVNDEILDELNILLAAQNNNERLKKEICIYSSTGAKRNLDEIIPSYDSIIIKCKSSDELALLKPYLENSSIKEKIVKIEIPFSKFSVDEIEALRVNGTVLSLVGSLEEYNSLISSKNITSNLIFKVIVINPNDLKELVWNDDIFLSFDFNKCENKKQVHSYIFNNINSFSRRGNIFKFLLTKLFAKELPDITITHLGSNGDEKRTFNYSKGCSCCWARSYCFIAQLYDFFDYDSVGLDSENCEIIRSLIEEFYHLVFRFRQEKILTLEPIEFTYNNKYEIKLINPF